MQRYFILIIILVAAYFFFNQSNVEGMGNCSDTTIYHFLYTTAALEYPNLVKEFGDPNIFVDEPGGIAIWRGADIFDAIELKDEAIEDLEPYSHCDFLYTTIRVHIPDNILPTILQLSKSIMYDRLKKNLTSRSNFMGANVAMLWLAMTMANNPNKSDYIGKEFSRAITASKESQNYKKMYSELRKMIEDNQTTYYKELEHRECIFTYGAGKTSGTQL